MRKPLHSISSIISSLIKEPLVQFLLIGAVIFMISEITSDWKDRQQHTITIDSSLEKYLENLYSVQFGFYPDEETLDRLVENYIREEVMYREALRLGLAEQDEIIRRRLVQKMEFLLKDNDEISEPDETILKAYYEQHAAEYIHPLRISFRHLYFSDDAAGKAQAGQRAGEALERIRSGHEQEVKTEADPFPLNDYYADLDQMGAHQLFGQSEFTQNIFKVPAGQWRGPFQSGYGWHLVFVENRIEASRPPYAEVAERVYREWRNENSARRFESALQDMIRRYEIKREAGSPGE